MSERAKVIGIAPQLIVADVKKTAEYYRDVLGFTIIEFFMDPPLYGMVQRDGFQVHFAKADDDAHTTNHNEDLRKEITDLVIWVPEIDLFFEELKGRNADIVHDIVQRSYGSREFVIRDCNGYKILVGD
jgi:catechol 2,3-dioxygenase-like lactoylglutathione lyase family enzyme